MTRKPSEQNNFKYYSEKYLISKLGTKSLAKLRLKWDDEIIRHAIVAYLYFNFSLDKFSKEDPLRKLWMNWIFI